MSDDALAAAQAQVPDQHQALQEARRQRAITACITELLDVY